MILYTKTQRNKKMQQKRPLRNCTFQARVTAEEKEFLTAALQNFRFNANETFMAKSLNVKKQPYKGAIIMDDVPKERVGISPNEFLAKLGKDRIIEDDTPSINVTSKLHEEKDYTAWQSDPLMQDIYNSCMWDAGGENQCYPEGVEKYQIKYKDLWGRLNEAKRNNKTQTCNEIMTEMMERIYNER